MCLESFEPEAGDNTRTETLFELDVDFIVQDAGLQISLEERTWLQWINDLARKTGRLHHGHVVVILIQRRKDRLLNFDVI